MEGSLFNEAPKFQSPEEELSYLRAHVANREQELMSQGHHERAQENAIMDVIGEYKDVPKEQVVLLLRNIFIFTYYIHNCIFLRTLVMPLRHQFLFPISNVGTQIT